MTTLADFLLARIAEDAAVARAAMPGPWLAGARDGAVASKFSTAEHGSHDASTFAVMLPGPEVWNPATAMANATHIARHDPARVLAECEAKRRIMERALAATEEHQRAVRAAPVVATPGRALRQGEDAGWWGALCLVAQPYADHPEFREEWKP